LEAASISLIFENIPATKAAWETMKKILVIEDEAQSRNIFLESLEAEGFNAIGAENGLVGVQRVQEELPDLIICDLVMPQLDGYQVLTKLRQDLMTAIIPFIFVTAKGTWTDLRKAKELGADDYLTKPFTLDELLRAIAACLEKRATLQQWYAAHFQRTPEPPCADTATSSVNPKPILPSVPKLRKIFDFIEANYHQSITLYDVAQAVGYSPTYLTNLVRCQTGQTVYCWIVERRMAEARSLLLNTDQPVNQIAAAVSYPDAGHFIRHFRKIHDTTPKMWRNMHRS
jgi:YesN/AraC family two-component response regulator